MRIRRLVVSLAVVSLGCRSERPPDVATPPRRIVSLAPSLTETVFALGAGDLLVGVSEFSDYPDQARKIPRIGGLEVSAERVASLSPDLVLAVREGNTRGPVTALAAAGIPVELVPGGSLDEVLSGIRNVGARIGRAKEAGVLTKELERRREEVRRRAQGRPRPKAVLLVWPDPPQAAGGGTFLDDVLSEAGAQNLLADRPGYPVISAEWLATAPLELFVVPDATGTRAAFERARASGALSRGSAAAARVVWVPEDALTRPGPRVFDALELLERTLPNAAGSS